MKRRNFIAGAAGAALVPGALPAKEKTDVFGYNKYGRAPNSPEQDAARRVADFFPHIKIEDFLEACCGEDGRVVLKTIVTTPGLSTYIGLYKNPEKDCVGDLSLESGARVRFLDPSLEAGARFLLREHVSGYGRPGPPVNPEYRTCGITTMTRPGRNLIFEMRFEVEGAEDKLRVATAVDVWEDPPHAVVDCHALALDGHAPADRQHPFSITDFLAQLEQKYS